LFFCQGTMALNLKIPDCEISLCQTDDCFTQQRAPSSFYLLFPL
jgi:hypothetical protein